jgi:trehalose 6-phosphate phosphatase
MIRGLEPIVAEVENRCRPGTIVSVFLDFDGTLVPIASDPAFPRLDAATRETLEQLSAKPQFFITIISGRAVEDLYTRIRIPTLTYAGNHGLEIFGRNLCFIEPTAVNVREKLERLSEDLAEKLKPIEGAIVEDKGLSVSVHYRQVSPEDVGAIQDAVREAVAGAGTFRSNTGRKVIEIVPPTNWNKGAAAQWITRHLGRDSNDIVSIYIGDDSTDEDAFSTLTDAITVKVGGCPTRAKFRVPGPDAVHEFLRWLARFEPMDADPLAALEFESGHRSGGESPPRNGRS